jgi:hypothetical protein
MRARAGDLLAEEADLAASLARTWGVAADEGTDGGAATLPRLHVEFDRLLAHSAVPVWSVTVTPEGPDVATVGAMGWNPVVGDGATLVKEVTRVGSERLTTGQSHWATDVKLWFVMIKDAEGRFPGNDLWGDGWGWALFLAKEPARNVATDYSTDCRTCHVPAKKDDWVYVRGYPALAKAAPAK